MSIALKVLGTSALGLLLALLFCAAEARSPSGNDLLVLIMGAVLLVSSFFFITSLLAIIWLS